MLKCSSSQLAASDGGVSGEDSVFFKGWPLGICLMLSNEQHKLAVASFSSFSFSRGYHKGEVDLGVLGREYDKGTLCEVSK